MSRCQRRARVPRGRHLREEMEKIGVDESCVYTPREGKERAGANALRRRSLLALTRQTHIE